MKIKVIKDSLGIDFRRAVGNFVCTLGKFQLAVHQAIAQGANGKLVDRHKNPTARRLDCDSVITGDMVGRVASVTLERFLPGCEGALASSESLEVFVEKSRLSD